MKNIKWAFLIVVAFASGNASAQNLTYKDLIGTWDKKDAKKEKFSFQFLDSAHVNIVSTNGDVASATYTLQTINQKAKLVVTTATAGVTSSNQYYITLTPKGILQLENLNTYDPVVQMHPKNGTLLFTKRSS